jgi:DNA repair exonuclease SbcCD ATPase subunit
MKLTLKNFKCYHYQSFEFDDDTLTLISGPSGQGKTTILQAIQFALYGSTLQKYLISHNKTTCEVVLEYKDFKIKRTKRPNILYVNWNNCVYEDKEAQVLLNKYFGVINSCVFFLDLSHFEKMGFLEKIVNADCNVKDLKLKIKNKVAELNKQLAVIDGQLSTATSMAGLIEKPEHMEEPVWVGKSHEVGKDELLIKKTELLRLLDVMTAKQKKWNELTSQKSVIESEISLLRSPSGNGLRGGETTELNSGVPDPSGVGRRSSRSDESVDDCVQQQVLNLESKLKQMTKQSLLFQKEREKFLIVKDALTELEKYKAITDETSTIISSQLEQLNESIKAQELKSQRVEYQHLLKQERDDWEQKVDKYQKLCAQASGTQSVPLDEPDKYLSGLKIQKLEYERAIEFASKHDLGRCNDEIAALKRSFLKRYQCLVCQTTLTINLDTFEQVESDGRDESPDSRNNPMQVEVNRLVQIKDKLKKLEKTKDRLVQDNCVIGARNLETIVVEIKNVSSYIESSAQLDQLKNFKPSKYLLKMEKNLGGAEELLEGDLDLELEKLLSLKKEHNKLTIKHGNVLQQLKIKKSILNKIETFKNAYDEVASGCLLDEIASVSELLRQRQMDLEKFKTKQRLEKQLYKFNEQIKEITPSRGWEITISDLNNQLDQIEEYLNWWASFEKYAEFQARLTKYDTTQQELTTLANKKKNLEHQYIKILLFKQKVVESEHESLQFMIDIINTHLSLFLQDFFSESTGDPIQIVLELLHEKRPQIDTIINYKGNRVDYKSLSTGEYARVKLAFDLTFKEILGEQIVMLDECTANLDQDLSTKIFNKIKTTFPTKTILVVAHQVVMGTFDNVLKLE